MSKMTQERTKSGSECDLYRIKYNTAADKYRLTRQTFLNNQQKCSSVFLLHINGERNQIFYFRAKLMKKFDKILLIT